MRRRCKFFVFRSRSLEGSVKVTNQKKKKQNASFCQRLDGVEREYTKNGHCHMINSPSIAEFNNSQSLMMH